MVPPANPPRPSTAELSRARDDLHLHAKLGDSKRVAELLAGSSGDHSIDDVKDGQTALTLAAEAGHDAVVRLLLHAKAQVDVRNQNCRTALIVAAEGGHEAVVRTLVDAKAQLDAQDEAGFAALMSCAWQGHDAVLRVLLGAGAQLELRDMNGKTALLVAARESSEAVVRLLIEAHAQLDVQDQNGWTPLMCSAWRGRQALVRLLVDAKAQLDVHYKDGGTALMLAAEAGEEAIVSVLVNAKALLDEVDQEGRTALMCAVTKGNETIVRMLVAAGAKLDIQTADGATALLIASDKESDAIVRQLVDAKAQTDLQTQAGKSALMLAAEADLQVNVQLLLEAKAQANLQDTAGRTALLCCAQWGYEQVARLLVDAHAQLDVTDKAGCTAVLCAARGGHAAVVRMLVAAGAKLDIQDADGKVAVVCAAMKGHDAVVQLLVDAKARLDLADKEGETALTATARRGSHPGSAALMRLLIEANVQVDAQNKMGETSLILAARDGCKELVRLLVEAKAQLDSQDKAGCTALVRAAEAGHEVTVRQLVKAKALLDVQCMDGQTALHHAARRGDLGVLKSLLDAGANPLLKNAAGDLPVDLASSGKAAIALQQAAASITLYRGRYEVNVVRQDPALRGASGWVMLAQDTILGSAVAIKLCREAEGRDNTVRVLKLLDGAFVAQLTGGEDCVFDDAGAYPDTPYAVVMMAGDATLHALLESVSAKGGAWLPENNIRFIFECLAQAVAHLHDRGVVHGDLKAKNCVRFFDGRYRLVDFDQARLVASKQEAGSTTAEICPPELARALLGQSKTPRASPLSDVWALGCLFFHLVTGQSLISQLVEDWDEDEEATCSNERILATLAALQTAHILAVIERVEKKGGMMRQQAASLMRRMLFVDPKLRCDLGAVLQHGFMRGDHTDTMRAKQWDGLHAMQVETVAKQDTTILLVKEVLVGVQRIEERTLLLQDLPAQLKQGMLDIGRKVSGLRAVVVGMSDCGCPTTFVIVPSVSERQSFQWRMKLGASAPPSMEEAVEGVEQEALTWVDDLKNVFTTPDTLARLVARFSHRQFRLKLVCDKCAAPCEPGYVIEKASPALVKLLPALQVSLKVLHVVNFGLGIARCFFPVVPVLPAEYTKRMQGVVDTLSHKSSAEKFACVQGALDKADEEGAGGGRPKQVQASAHQLKEFLREKDPSNQWGGLTRVVLPDEAGEAAPLPAAAVGQDRGKATGPVVWCCSRCLLAPEDDSRDASHSSTASARAAGAGAGAEESKGVTVVVVPALPLGAVLALQQQLAQVQAQLLQAQKEVLRLSPSAALRTAGGEGGSGCFNRRTSGSGKVHPAEGV